MNSAHVRIAIVGGATLKGREIADLLKERNFPARDVRLLDSDESLGQLESMGDEVTFVQRINRDQLEHVDIAFLASDEKYTRRTWQMVRDAGCSIVDLSYALEDQPGSVIRAPWIERELGRSPAPELQPAPVVVAHPAAIVLALLLLRAQRAAPIRKAVATVIEPASELGRGGMDELHEQTVNLLSFKELPKQVFDQQIAFNMLARYGPGATSTLENTERRISRHFRAITADQAVAPALMLLQGPSFHGHAFALYVELEHPAEVGDLSRVLAADHVQINMSADDSPTNVSAAGQSDILVYPRRDGQHENGFWLWATADNLRLSALCAIECAENMARARPRGQVQ